MKESDSKGAQGMFHSLLPFQASTTQNISPATQSISHRVKESQVSWRGQGKLKKKNQNLVQWTRVKGIGTSLPGQGSSNIEDFEKLLPGRPGHGRLTCGLEDEWEGQGITVSIIKKKKKKK